MKIGIVVTSFILVYSLFPISNTTTMNPTSFYDYQLRTIDGQNFDLSTLKGKKVMIVNVASKCGLTPQYKELQSLYDEYGGENFEILGFPANNFGAQEPGTEQQIQSFCELNYGVTFKMFEKISVKGKDQHPFYQWLTNKELNGSLSVSVKWNFQKFLIDENGNLIDYLLPTTSPKSKKVIQWLQQ